MKLLESIRQLPWFHSPPKTLGKRGEMAAIRFLKRKRFIILAASENVGVGEIDIIAVDRRNKQRVIVFVEVKTRSSDDKGTPADAVDEQKQKQITRAATVYIRRHALEEYSTRFDIVSIMWPANQPKPTIEHFESAFDAITGPFD